MADRRPHALDDDSFPVELFRSRPSDRRAADPAGDVEAASADPDLVLPGADELFPPAPAAADDNVDNAFDPPKPAGEMQEIASAPGPAPFMTPQLPAEQDDEPLASVTQVAATAATRTEQPIAPAMAATRAEQPIAPASDSAVPQSPREPVAEQEEQPFVWPKPFPLPRPIPPLSFTPPPDSEAPAAPPSELKAASPPATPAAPTPRAEEAPPAPRVPPRAQARPATARPSAADILRAIDALPSVGLPARAAPLLPNPPADSSPSSAPTAPSPSSLRAESERVDHDQASGREADASSIRLAQTVMPTPPAPLTHVPADRIEPASPPVVEIPEPVAVPPFELTAWTGSTSAAAQDHGAPSADSANDFDAASPSAKSDALNLLPLLELPVLAAADFAMPRLGPPHREPSSRLPQNPIDAPRDASATNPNKTTSDAPAAVAARPVDMPPVSLRPHGDRSPGIEPPIPPFDPATRRRAAAALDKAEASPAAPPASAAPPAPAAPPWWTTRFPSRELPSAAPPSASAPSSATGGVETPSPSPEAAPITSAPVIVPAAPIDPTPAGAPTTSAAPPAQTTTAVSVAIAPAAPTPPLESPAQPASGAVPSVAPSPVSLPPAGSVAPLASVAPPAPVVQKVAPQAASVAPLASLTLSTPVAAEVPAMATPPAIAPESRTAPARDVARAPEVTVVAPALPVTVIAPATPQPAQLAASTPSPAAAAVVEPTPAIPPQGAAVSRDEPAADTPTPTRIAEPPAEPRTAPEPAAPPAVSGLSMERLTNLDDLLRLAASCGASTLYLAPNARPSVRVGGELWVLEDIPILEPPELDALLFALKLAHDADASAFAGGEWTFDLPGAGRIRCMTFSDQRGPGSVFRIVPARTVVADQLGLSLETQALTLEKDGLILVTGPRSSGKNAVIGGLLDLINRTRQAYIVTVQREVNATWEGERAFISQREARGGLDDMLAVGRAALRENPDVLVLQEVRSAALMSLALDAAASGQLVIAGYTARTAPAAIAGVLSLYPVEQRRNVQVSLAQSLRGVVAQTLVPRAGGGRAAARELLLNTPPIAAALAEGKIWQLSLAIEAGRNHGMVTMNEALVDLVQRGVVAAEDAYRQAPEQMVFLDALKRNGIDTSFVD